MKLIAGLCAVLTFAGVVATFGREYDAALIARSPEFNQLSALAAPMFPVRRPFSLRAQRELMDTCTKVRLGLFYGLQSAEIRAQIDQNCIKMADDVLRRSPTLSVAHVTRMLHAATPDDLVDALVASKATAPFEYWDAQKRISTGLPLFGDGFSDLDTAIISDVGFVMALASGRDFLAQTYIDNISLRPAITQLVEAAPSSEQAAFLSRVRSNVR
jgi:hypothetical protein